MLILLIQYKLTMKNNSCNILQMKFLKKIKETVLFYMNVANIFSKKKIKWELLI